MQFVDAATTPADLAALRAWAVARLVEPGYLADPKGRSAVPYLCEPGVGILTIDGPRARGSAVGSMLAAPDAARLVSSARDRVVHTLRGLLVWPAQDGFVHGALYAGRVQRLASNDGSRNWTVRAGHDAALSDIVLALFAADLLEDRRRYDEELNICDRCTSLGFEGRSVSRFGCRKHPKG